MSFLGVIIAELYRSSELYLKVRKQLLKKIYFVKDKNINFDLFVRREKAFEIVKSLNLDETTV